MNKSNKLKVNIKSPNPNKHAILKKLSHNLISELFLNFFTFDNVTQMMKINQRIKKILSRSDMFSSYVEIFNNKTAKTTINEVYFKYKDILSEENLNVLMFNLFFISLRLDENIDYESFNKIPENYLRDYVECDYNNLPLIVYCKHKLVQSITALYELKNGMIIYGRSDNSMAVLDPKNNYEIVQEMKNNNLIVSSIAQMTNGLIITGSWDNSIKVLDPLKDYEVVRVLNGHTGLINAVVILKNGLIASASYDSTIRIWDPKDVKDSKDQYKCIKVINAHNTAVSDLCELAEYDILVSSSYDKTIKFWNINDFECTNSIKRDLTGISQLLYIDSKRFATVTSDNNARVFELKEKTAIVTKIYPFKFHLTTNGFIYPDILVCGLKTGLLYFHKFSNAKTTSPPIKTVSHSKDESIKLIKQLASGNLIVASDNVLKVYEIIRKSKEKI